MIQRRSLSLVRWHSARSCVTASSSPSFRSVSFLSHPKLQKSSGLLNPKPLPPPPPSLPSLSGLVGFSRKPDPTIFPPAVLRFVSTESSQDVEEDNPDDRLPGCTSFGLSGEEIEEGDTTDGWEEGDVGDPEIGDGGDGGGLVLQGVPWGERALSIALEVLTQFEDNGCPSVEELERYSQEYKKRLDEVGELGEIPENLALEVSSPGAERLLKVPDDLQRFEDMPMRVCYAEEVDSKHQEKDRVFNLESIEAESESCVWNLANVKENRDPNSKGRLLTRKQRDWRLKLPFSGHKRVLLYLEY